VVNGLICTAKLGIWFRFLNFCFGIHVKKVILITTLVLLAIFPPLSIDMYLPAFTKIADFLHVNTNMVQISLTIFLLGYTFAQLIFGPISDRFGRKYVLLIGTTIFILGSILCAYSSTLWSFYSARLIQSIGAGSGAVISLAIIRDSFEHDERLHYLGLISTVMGFAPLVAPIIGGKIILLYKWQYIFVSLGAVGALTLILIFIIDESHTKLTKVSVIELYNNYITIIKNKMFILPAVVNALAFSTMFIYISGSPHLLLGLFKISPSNFGFYFAFNAIAVIFGNFIATRLNKRFNSELVQLLASMLSAISAILLMVLSYNTSNVLMVIVPMFFVTTGVGGMFPTATGNSIKAISEHIGQASALITFIRFGGATIITLFVAQINFQNCNLFSLIVLICSALALLVSIYHYRISYIVNINSIEHY
jgi:DHA1 family bicyclomycin/chloramphenicol resistance-like MFS transporter